MKLIQLKLLFLFTCVHTLKNCLGNLEIRGLCILQREWGGFELVSLESLYETKNEK